MRSDKYLKVKVWYLADAFIQSDLQKHPAVAVNQTAEKAATLTTSSQEVVNAGENDFIPDGIQN